MARQAVDIVLLILARARFDMLTLLTRLTTSTVLTIICALPIYWLLYKSQYRYHVIGISAWVFSGFTGCFRGM